MRNHLSSEKLRARMGTDLFVYHGYAALHVGGAWRKVSPAFNAELCARFGVPPLEFDGRSDALLHAYDGEGRQHMEYLTDHGTFSGVPFDAMLAAFQAALDAGTAVADQALDAIRQNVRRYSIGDFLPTPSERDALLRLLVLL